MAGHEVAIFIKGAARSKIKSALGPDNQDLLIGSGHGQFNAWTDVPWIGVFDPVVTTSAQRGFYIVYLFAEDLGAVYLSLNQGATAVDREFKGKAPAILRQRAGLMQTRLQCIETRATEDAIELGSTNRPPLLYEAGHALGFRYETVDLPTESKMQRDLFDLLNLYLQLTSRGGLSPSGAMSVEAKEAGLVTIEEQRKYGYHRRIERSSNTGKKVKKVRGYICEGCDFNFERTYGPVGKGYIEAHHLTPISELPVGERVTLDPKTDFVVLCANCHRMMHRKEGPRTLSELQAALSLSGTPLPPTRQQSPRSG